MKLTLTAALLCAMTTVCIGDSTPAYAQTKGQKEQDSAAEAQAKSDAQASKGHTVRAAHQAKKAQEDSQSANQDQAKSAAKVGKSRKKHK